MIYKLLHVLFKWDYIHWENSADYGIARVQVSPDGTVYFWQYRITKLMKTITDPKQVHWLTCKPDKYMKENIHARHR